MITLRKNILKALSEQIGFSLSTPWEKLSKEVKNLILHGDEEQQFEIKLEYGRGKKAKVQSFPGVLKDLEDTINQHRATICGPNYILFNTVPSARIARVADYLHTHDPCCWQVHPWKNFSLPRQLKHGNFIRKKARQDENCLRVEDALYGLEERLGFINEVGLGYLGTGPALP